MVMLLTAGSSVVGLFKRPVPNIACVSQPSNSSHSRWPVYLVSLHHTGTFVCWRRCSAGRRATWAADSRVVCDVDSSSTLHGLRHRVGARRLQDGPGAARDRDRRVPTLPQRGHQAFVTTAGRVD